jgi:hypothetical protein
MKSPGAPAHRRDVEREFWRELAKGLLAEEAALAVGVSQAVGSRWFRHRGGMPIDLGPLSGRYLTFREREEIAILRARGAGVREIARQLGRGASTISRELRRNAATRGGKLEYRASVAQWKAELVAQRPRTAKLAGNDRLREYVQERLSGQVRRLDGTPVAGPPTAPWKGRNKPHRGDRRWVTAWSPEQIASRLKADFPDDESMRISYEAIYQALRCVVATAIGMENSINGERVVTGGHLDGLLDKLGLIMIVSRPADHGFGVAVDDRGQVKPALPGRNIGDVADHLLAGCGGGEIAAHEVGDGVLLAVALGEAEPPRPWLAGLQAQLTHQGPHQLRPRGHTPVRQVRVHPPVPIRLIRIIE